MTRYDLMRQSSSTTRFEPTKGDLWETAAFYHHEAGKIGLCDREVSFDQCQESRCIEARKAFGDPK